MTLHHIAILCSSACSIQFYEALGFILIKRHARPERNDEIVMMSGNGITLELFIDENHPQRLTNPEAMGLRHLAFKVEDVSDITKKMAQYHPELIRLDSFTGERMTFVKDPDGLPIELHE